MKNLKKLAFYGVVGLLSFTISACSEVSTENNETADVVIDQDDLLVAEYSIDGMVCAMGCAKTIQDEVADMSGVAACAVDFESGKAYIEFDKTKLNENEIIATIEGMADGMYKVSKWEEPIEAVESGDLEASEESEETTAEVSLPNIEIPNLFKLLFNQL